jgi:hypothetical protein
MFGAIEFASKTKLSPKNYCKITNALQLRSFEIPASRRLFYSRTFALPFLTVVTKMHSWMANSTTFPSSWPLDNSLAMSLYRKLIIGNPIDDLLMQQAIHLPATSVGQVVLEVMDRVRRRYGMDWASIALATNLDAKLVLLGFYFSARNERHKNFHQN